MDNGNEVIGKVPNPNAGLTHYSTASEVATLDFVRTVLETPVPRVLAWDSHADRNSVGAEYIVMEKIAGVPLGHFWDQMTLSDKLQIFLQVVKMMKSMLATSLPGYGSLYYAADVPGTSLPVAADKRFVVGPATGRDWCDAGRQELHCDRGPWYTALEYRRAIGERERAAIQDLPENPKQMVMLTGPGELYQPSRKNKLWALDEYLQVLESVLPAETEIMSPGRLWHDDLHDENIFVDPNNPTKITGIIDWQSTQVAPLFDHHMDPAFLDYRGSDIGDNLEMPSPLDPTGLSDEQYAVAQAQETAHALMVGWRLLISGRNKVQYRTAIFQASTAGNILRVARRIYEMGEAHLAMLLLKRGTISSLDTDTSDRIQRDVKAANMGIDLLSQVETQMGGAWPDKGLVRHDEYEETKALLVAARDQIAELLYKDSESAREFCKTWPFDT